MNVHPISEAQNTFDESALKVGVNWFVCDQIVNGVEHPMPEALGLGESIEYSENIALGNSARSPRHRAQPVQVNHGGSRLCGTTGRNQLIDGSGGSRLDTVVEQCLIRIPGTKVGKKNDQCRTVEKCLRYQS
jgi:hypothetical protein